MNYPKPSEVSLLRLKEEGENLDQSQCLGKKM
jgi:hypothetical protein